MLQLIIHQWKEKIRSPFWQKSIILNIFLGIVGLYLLLNIVMIGLTAGKIIHEICKDCDVIKTATGFLFYYFLFDLILRFLLQQVPTLSMQPYLTLPIKKSRLLHYPIVKSITSFFNVLAMLLFLPFFFETIVPAQSLQFSLTWIITVFSLIAINNFLNFSLKKYFSKRPLLILLIIIIAALLIYFDLTGIISLSGYFAKVIYYLADNVLFVAIVVMLAVLSYYLAYALLKRNAYIEDVENRVSKKTKDFSFFSRYGEIGQLFGVELKMIFRNKRPRSLLYLGIIFLLYGLIFYRKDNMNNMLILSFIGFFLTAILAVNFGQFIFSWDSSFFDFYLANKVLITNYVKSKYLFLSVLCIVCFIVTLPYVFISNKIVFINAAFLLYNIGITIIMLMFFSTFSTSYIDLGKNQFMNHQGVGLTQFLIIIPIMGFPLIIYFIFKMIGLINYYYAAIAIIGLLGIVFNKYLLELIASQLSKRKYMMASGFRKK